MTTTVLEREHRLERHAADKGAHKVRKQVEKAKAKGLGADTPGGVALMNHPQHIQPLALAAAFIVLSNHLRVPAQDLFAVTTNMMAEEENIAEFKAVKDYIKYEIKRA